MSLVFKINVIKLKNVNKIASKYSNIYNMKLNCKKIGGIMLNE